MLLKHGRLFFSVAQEENHIHGFIRSYFVLNSEPTMCQPLFWGLNE